MFWAEQSSALTIGTDAGSADLFTMSIRLAKRPRD
jgi:hypothetical protein